MSKDNKPMFRLYNDRYHSGMTDENSLSAALLTDPDLLSPILTHLAGREDKRFPLSFLTEGLGNRKTIQGPDYEYPVIGRHKRSSTVAVTNSVTNAGIGRTEVDVIFNERRFPAQYYIRSKSGRLAQIVAEPQKVSKGWLYKLRLSTRSAEDYFPADDLIAGATFTLMFAAVAFGGGSRGNESYWKAPSKLTNQISLIRKSYSYEGNVQNRTVNIELNLGGKKTKLWTEFEEWQHMLQWMEDIESFYWYSQYNKDAEGIIHDVDLNSGKVITLGSGVLEQIPNYDTYATLTTKKIKNVVRDVMFGAADAQKMNVVLYTGLGGLEEFDEAMKRDVAGRGWMTVNEPKFITGSGRNLQLGGYFNQYQHIDGHVITVAHLPLFDMGPVAEASPKHPKTGLPMESYRMVFLDQSQYDGESNVTMVTQKGREMKRWAVAGAEIPRGFTGNNLRASDIDGSSVHLMKSCGINIRRATNCLHLECVAA